MASISVDVVIKYLLTLATCALGLLRARMDDKTLSVHDNDARAGHPIISDVLEVYGHFLTAIIYAFVEIVACIRFALIHRLQGSRKHILPVVKRRSQAILYACFDRVIHWATSRMENFLRTGTGAVVSRFSAPCAAVLRGCHEDLCALFGNDCLEVAREYLLKLLGRGLSHITGLIGSFLDSVARKAHRSTLLWLVYMPIATWFSLSLCALSVFLALVAPYILYASPVSPCNLKMSAHTGQPLRPQCVAVEIPEGAMSAAYHDEYSADFGSNAFISTSTSTSIHIAAVQESPSLNLSVILADMDPHADMSTLLTLEMNFVPEIFVTPADESVQISRLSERHFEFSRSYDELEDISNVNNDAASQDDIFPPTEALSITSTTSTDEDDTVSDLSVVEKVVEDSQVLFAPATSRVNSSTPSIRLAMRRQSLPPPRYVCLSCLVKLCNLPHIFYLTGGNSGDAAAAARRPGRERHIPAVPRQQRPYPAPHRPPLPSSSQPTCRKGTRSGRHIRPLHGLPGPVRGCECFISFCFPTSANSSPAAYRLKAVRHVQPRSGRGSHQRGRHAVARVRQGGCCGSHAAHKGAYFPFLAS